MIILLIFTGLVLYGVYSWRKSSAKYEASRDEQRSFSFMFVDKTGLTYLIDIETSWNKMSESIREVEVTRKLKFTGLMRNKV